MSKIKSKILSKLLEKGKEGFESVKGSLNGTIEKSEDLIAGYTVERVLEASDSIVSELKKDAAGIIEQTANSLGEQEKDSWNILREQIAPKGGFFNTLFARLLWVGSKVSSFVGALVVDNWTGNNDKEKNGSGLEVIFSWMLGNMFSKKNPASA